ncbi:MAG TPA: DUF3373 family protein, partial [Nitrospirota bacterium]|nr:DUF3373 family protein [Nitrospirota bacterium]
VDYAFDGMTLGYAPDIDKLPGAYVKLCYGRGFESGFNDKYSTTGTTLKDTDFMGINAAIIDTDALHAELQYQKGWHIFDMPSDGVASFGTTRPTQNLGDLDWIGGVVMGKVKSINWFFSAARSHTSPNDNTFMNNGQTGLLWTGTKESHSGNAIYLGGRYDIDSTGTKIGAEYNQGSKYWIGMVPAADDVWTSKLGTRGSVYEIYIIQELKNKPISKDGKAFFKLGYQYYKFDYTGSNFWVGAPVKISDLSQDVSNPNNYQMLAPLQKATDIYLTFEVRF